LSTRQPILTLDVSQGLDMALEAALIGTDFALDRCGSEVAILHKLRGGEPYMIVLENRRPVARPEAIHDILDLAMEKGVPLLFVSGTPLPEETRRLLGFFLKVVEPPIYPYRLLREIKSFEWREETVYVMKMAGKKAKAFTVIYVPAADADPGTEALLRQTWEAKGNRFLCVERIESAAEQAASQEKALVLFEVGADPRAAVDGLRRIDAGIRQGGVVALVDPAASTPSLLQSLLHNGALTVLPRPLGDDDLGELYDNLRFVRERSR